MLHWVGHHFADFDTDDEGMISFLDRFEEYCKEDVSIGEGWGRDGEGGGGMEREGEGWRGRGRDGEGGGGMEREGD